MPRKPGLEAAVMDILWDTPRRLTPSEVRDQLSSDRDAAYTTVMTALVRLWKKGLLDRRRRGRAFEYTPGAGRIDSAAQRMESILDTAGDRTTTLARFLDTLSASERRALREFLEP